MAPIVHGLEAEYFGKINFFFLDADDPATLDLRRQFGFRVQPELYLLGEDGNVLHAWKGYMSADDFRTVVWQTLGE